MVPLVMIVRHVLCDGSSKMTLPQASGDTQNRPVVDT